MKVPWLVPGRISPKVTLLNIASSMLLIEVLIDQPMTVSGCSKTRTGMATFGGPQTTMVKSHFWLRYHTRERLLEQLNKPFAAVRHVKLEMINIALVESASWSNRCCPVENDLADLTTDNWLNGSSHNCNGTVMRTSLAFENHMIYLRYH